MTSSNLTQQLAEVLLHHNWTLATAESCTGGLIASRCTELSGSSQWFERGFVTYSNEAKHQMLGVDSALIAEHGAVSEAVAQAMAKGALRHSLAQVAMAVTGIAGPTGGTVDKPVGTVWFGWATPSDIGPTLGEAQGACVKTELKHFTGNRAAVREAAAHHALSILLNLLVRH